MGAACGCDGGSNDKDTEIEKDKSKRAAQGTGQTQDLSYQTSNYDDFFEPQNLPNEVVAEYREQQGRFNYDGESDNDGKREKREET